MVQQTFNIPEAKVEPANGGKSYFCAECGEDHTRVTSLLSACLPKPALVPWAEKMGRESILGLLRRDIDPLALDKRDLKQVIADEGLGAEAAKQSGASRGGIVHDFLEGYIRSGGIIPALPEDQTTLPYIKSLAKFLVEYEPEFHATEFYVVSHELGYAGRCDGICTIHKQPPRRNKPFDLTGKRVLFDLKTNRDGRVYKPEHYYQTAAYEYAWRQMGGEPNDHQIVAALGEEKWQVGVSKFHPDAIVPLAAFYSSMQDEMER